VPKVLRDDGGGEPRPTTEAAAAATATLLSIVGTHEPRVPIDGDPKGDEALVVGAALARYRGLMAMRLLDGWDSRGLKS
jgi:hypothetical protein